MILTPDHLVVTIDIFATIKTVSLPLLTPFNINQYH